MSDDSQVPFFFEWSENREPFRSGTLTINLEDDERLSMEDLSDEAYERAHTLVEIELNHTSFNLFDS